MDKTDIEKYLQMVGEVLHENGQNLEITLLGGAVMLIEVGNREITYDIDTFFVSDFTAILKASIVVANHEHLPDGWLNTAAAGFTYNFIKQPERKLWRKFPGLEVYTASLEYVFVTKIMAARPKDDDDIKALAKLLNISRRKDVLALVELYVPKEDISTGVLREIRRRFRA